eukprot:GDKJ01046196.1.p1 GENE.GDKJ01046196.1~~GDKJ01046196.1.p1  ORF type:complete len:113 (+),score=10.44 GDKJ01046196.1:13-351(+)
MHIRSLLISAAVACTFALETKETHTISAHTFAETETEGKKKDICSTQSEETNAENKEVAQTICGHKCDVDIASYGHAHNLSWSPDYMICHGSCEKYTKSYQGRKQLNVRCEG